MPEQPSRQFTHIRITRHLIQGLGVESDDGETGLIRIREISWKREDAADWKQSYPIGWDGYAVEIPLKKGEIRELSLRLVEYDPWEDFIEGIKKEQILEGVVTGVHDYGVFVELDEGITGLLHKSQIPPKLQASILETFWYNDRVKVVIREIDHDNRRIELRPAPLDNLSGKGIPRVATQASGIYEAHTSLDQSLEAEIRSRHILVVEDEVLQSEMVCKWLRELRQRVNAVNSAEEAIKYLGKSQPEIALIDVGLPGMNGLELAHYIFDHYPQVQVVNATDWARAEEVGTGVEAVLQRGGKLIHKPIIPDDLLIYLQEQQADMPVKDTKEKSALLPVEKNSRKSLLKLLTNLRKYLNMEQVFLFSFDSAHRKISIYERSGDTFLNKSAVSQLVHSPVRDAAEDGETFFLNEIGEREKKRFQYLLEFCPDISACIGVPIPVESATQYALFAMDSRKKTFGDEIKIYIEGMALAVGSALDQINLREQAALMQRSALTGNLASGMIHEINNLLAPLQQESDNLRKSLALAEKQTSNHVVASIKAEFTNIEQDINQIVNTVRVFGNIQKKGQVEMLRIDQIIKNTLVMLGQIGKRSRVEMHFLAPEKLVIVQNKAVILEQILLNICLNAIQQISEHRQEGGSIRIELEEGKEAKDGVMCRILVHDNGPGIHFSLWEKIFELGYSTRADGSGIGLYVSRNLMEDAGGRLYVWESHILFGSVFALEFPVAQGSI